MIARNPMEVQVELLRGSMVIDTSFARVRPS